MNVRTLVGALLAAPAVLVTMATNGHAATPQGAVAFAGRITIQPTLTSTQGSATYCFSAVECSLGEGAAIGAVNAKPVVTMTGTLKSVETCTASLAYAPLSSGTLEASFKDVAGTQVGDVHGTWTRAGLIAVITPGDSTVAGAALAVPLPKQGTVPLCGAPIELAVVGAIAFA